MTADEVALLRAVLTDPADDLPRLVYADWCDDHGHADRAEFIRLQIELDRMSQAERLPSELRARSANLFHAGFIGHAGGWAAGLAIQWDGYECWALTGDRRPVMRVTGRRGFVAAVEPPLTALIGGACWRCSGDGSPAAEDAADRCRACGGAGAVAGFAADLFAEQPVTAVWVYDRQPYSTENPLLPWWWDEGPGLPVENALPPELFRLLPPPMVRQGRSIGYATEDDARLAASIAAVRYGRDLAGLPTLPLPPDRFPTPPLIPSD